MPIIAINGNTDDGINPNGNGGNSGSFGNNNNNGNNGQLFLLRYFMASKPTNLSNLFMKISRSKIILTFKAFLAKNISNDDIEINQKPFYVLKVKVSN